MTTPYLHGNHDPRPACEMRREVQDTTAIARELIPCNVCAGLGHLPLSDAEIVRRTCIEARRVYWPRFTQSTPTTACQGADAVSGTLPHQA